MVINRGGAKFTSVVLTTLVLGLLIFSGPAQAYTLGLTILDSTINQGENVNFSVKVDFNENDKPLDYIELSLIGLTNTSCRFDESGNKLNECKGINIIKIASNDSGYGSGYGYGYGYGQEKNLDFNVSLNTSTYVPGTYKTEIKIKSGETETVKEGNHVYISSSIKPFEDCSVRGKAGVINYNGKNFTANHLNFYVAGKRVVGGEGYLTSQLGRTTFSYKFKVKEVLETNENFVKIKVEGKSRIGLEKEKIETAVITVNRKTKVLNIVSDNFTLENMKGSFIEKDC